MPAPNGYYDFSQAAAFLGISVATVRNWHKVGLLVAEKSGNRSFFSGDTLQALQVAISEGRAGRLGTRANKRGRRGSRHHVELGGSALIRSISALCASLVSAGVSHAGIMTGIGQVLLLRKNAPHLAAHVSKQLSDALPEDQVRELAEKLPEAQGEDLLGIAYQHLRSDGEKSGIGMVFTPYELAEPQVRELMYRDAIFLDPCCGAGVYLLAAGRMLREQGVTRWWEQVVGMDIDPLSVLCATLNCYLDMEDDCFGDPRILCGNALTETEKLQAICPQVDVIVSNPPWGAYLDQKQMQALSSRWPAVTSGESFSYFICMALSLLDKGGCLSYLLPESICFTTQHRDIRGVLLASGLSRIVSHGKMFRGMLTSVVRIDCMPGTVSADVAIRDGQHAYTIARTRFSEEEHQVFGFNVREEDALLLARIESMPHLTLKNAADWSLGIVTGNNARFVSAVQEPGMEPVCKGKDVQPYISGQPSSYIAFDRSQFQQCPEERVFRAPEKLIYRFISSDLCFAYDNTGMLTLNSANIVIPKLEYGIAYVLGALNAAYANFYFRKKFNALKVLRSHIESIPIPSMPEASRDIVSASVRAIIAGAPREMHQARIDAEFNAYFGVTFPRR